MNKIKIDLAKKTLLFLENNSWKDIKLDSIMSKKYPNDIKNKHDILINLNRYFDYELKKTVINLEDSSFKDQIFEILMARFDILSKYKISIVKLVKYFQSNPHSFIRLIPSFVESIILILTMTKSNINGIKGAALIKGTFILYVLTTFTWINDNTPSLEKTMTTLDKYLDNLNKILKIIT